MHHLTKPLLCLAWPPPQGCDLNQVQLYHSVITVVAALGDWGGEVNKASLSSALMAITSLLTLAHSHPNFGAILTRELRVCVVGTRASIRPEEKKPFSLLPG